MATREEVQGLVAEIARAIKASDLLSLLVPPEKRFARRRLRQPCSGNPNPVSEIPKSVLDERVRPIKSVLERIDAQKLLGLEILDQRTTAGPRLREGVLCRPICDLIKPEFYINNDVSMNGSSFDDDCSNSSNHNDKSSMVRYLHIAEVPDEYTIGIFVFGPHERIPLHDHPEMCVLSRVLYGSLKRLSLDLDRNGRSPNDVYSDLSTMDIDEQDVEDTTTSSNNHTEDDPNNASISSIHNFLEKQSNNNQSESSSGINNTSSSSFLVAALSRSANWIHQNLYNGSSSSGITIESESDPKQQQQQQQQYYVEGTKIAYPNAIDILEAPSVASLYPYEGNLHEFVAGPYGAAVLDVLLPPYDDERKRDCTFYNILEIPSRPNPSPSTKRRGRWRDNKSRVVGKTTTVNNKIATTKSSRLQREPCLIVPTGQPENFHCISGRYKDLGEADDYEFDED